MNPLIISGTCKELYSCEKLLKRFGYIPRGCYLKNCDNHESGFIFINKEGDFSFHETNPYPEYERIVTASDFLKNYGLLGVRSCYSFRSLYLVISGLLFMMGFEESTPLGCWILVGLLAVNIPLFWKEIHDFITKLN
jgi:hypothetical protein